MKTKIENKLCECPQCTKFAEIVIQIERNRIRALIEKKSNSYKQVFPKMFDNPPKDQPLMDIVAWNFAIKYLDNFLRQFEKEILEELGE